MLKISLVKDIHFSVQIFVSGLQRRENIPRTFDKYQASEEIPWCCEDWWPPHNLDFLIKGFVLTGKPFPDKRLCGSQVISNCKMLLVVLLRDILLKLTVYLTQAFRSEGFLSVKYVYQSGEKDSVFAVCVRKSLVYNSPCVTHVTVWWSPGGWSFCILPKFFNFRYKDIYKMVEKTYQSVVVNKHKILYSYNNMAKCHVHSVVEDLMIKHRVWKQQNSAMAPHPQTVLMINKSMNHVIPLKTKARILRKVG